MSNYALQVQENASPEYDNRAYVTVYADMLQVKTPHQNMQGGGRRGACKGFSDDSRRRLVYKLAQLSLGGLHVYFVTLTYPAVYASDWQVWKNDLDNFRKAIERRFSQADGVIWREEFQKRGAPHFHLILVCSKPLPSLAKAIVSQIWARVVQEGYISSGGEYEAYSEHFQKHKRVGTQVKQMDGRKAIKCYVSKYIAKCEDNTRPTEWGRSWGVWNMNGELDFSPVEQITLDYKQGVIFKRLVRRWLKACGRVKLASFMGKMVSYSALGLGSESDNSDLAYKMLAGASKGLFKPHISPSGCGGGLTFIERVQLGMVDIRKAVQEGVKVVTPLGIGTVLSVVRCDVLHRVRCSVLLDEAHTGKKWAAFDLWQVKVYEHETASQVALW